jgi:hypothetical protein
MSWPPTQRRPQYLAIFGAFYADDIEASSETGEEPIRGKARVRSVLFNFLVPLHVMAGVGGLSISIRETAIPGDAADERHSASTLDLVGVSGRTCTLSWSTLRKWKGSRVVYEHHYDHQQSGGPLTSDDLSLNAATACCGVSKSLITSPNMRQERTNRKLFRTKGVFLCGSCNS